MPIFEYSCNTCHERMEVLVSGSNIEPKCPACGSSDLKKELSVPSSLSGVSNGRMTSTDVGGCCGANPEQAGCPGPGSCCGRNMAMP
ncbi:hypothetical protein KKI24_15275 [bacterium]|nr:hypothetical protein [bacterium]